jgi:kynurenine formamidase
VDAVQRDETQIMSAGEFRRLFDDVRAWAPSEDGRVGALRHLTPERVAAAAGLVRSGITCSLGHDLDTVRGLENPSPADHHMTLLPTSDAGPDDGDPSLAGVRFAKDYVGVDYHGDTHSHIDALSHVAFDGRLYGGTPAQSVTLDGATVGTIEALRDGLVGRGVLLDIPRVRGVPWLEPGDSVTPDDVAAAEREQGVQAGPGDILLIRTGHARRLREMPEWDPGRAKAGLHPAVAPYLAERQVAAVGSDGNSDTAPSVVEGVGYPMHVLAINALGLHLLDYLTFDEVLPYCESEGRWAFFFVALPLRVVRGTGSPINPVAML